MSHHRRGAIAREKKKKFFSLIHKAAGKRAEDEVDYICEHLKQQFPFFRQLREKSIRGVAQCIFPRHVHEDEPIYIEGHMPDSIAFIYSGTVCAHSKAVAGQIPFDHKIERIYGKEQYKLGTGDTCGVDTLLELISRVPKTKRGRHEHISLDDLPSTGAHLESFIASREICTIVEIEISDFLSYLYPYHTTISWQPGRCISILSQPSSIRTKDDLSIVLKFIRQVAFFKQIARNNQLQLCEVMEIATFEKGATVFREGDEGNTFYVIIHGTASIHVESAGGVEIEGQEESAEKNPTLTPIASLYKDGEYEKTYGYAVAELVEGDSFGEQALLSNHPRNATIRCQSDILKMIVISREQYSSIIAPRSNELVANVKKATAALEKNPEVRDDDDIAILKRLVGPLAFFKQLPPQHIESILRNCSKVDLAPECTLFRQGESGVSMYVIMQGFVNVFVKSDQESPENDVGDAVANLIVGDSFGEMALMRGEPRNATIIAGLDGAELLEISKSDYDKIAKNTNIVYNISHQIDILHKPSENRMPGDVEELLGFVKQLSFFKQLPNSCVRALCKHISHGHVEAGVPVMLQGDMNVDGFYIILNGSVSIHVLESQTEPSASAMKEMGLSLAGHMDPDEQEEDSTNMFFPHADIHPAAYKHIDLLLGNCVGILTSGDTFGEMGMKSEFQIPKRRASIIAREATEILVINSEQFNKWLKDRQLNFEPAVCRRLLQKDPHERTQEDVSTLEKLLGSIDFFHELTPAMRTGLLSRVKLKTFQFEDIIFRQGQSGKSMLAIIDGNVNVHVNEHAEEEEEAVTAYSSLSTPSNPAERLSARRNTAMVANKMWSKLKDANKIFVKGKRKSVMQALLSRRAKYNNDDNEENLGIVVGSLGVGDSVGETSLLKGTPRTASIVVSSKTCDCIEIKKEDFDLIIADHVKEIDFHAHSTHKTIEKASANGTSLRGDRRLFEQVTKPLPVFQAMDKSTRDDILRLLDARFFKQEEVIYRKGDQSKNVYTIVSGGVDFVEHNPVDGRNISIGKVHEHSQFGAIEVLSGVKREMTARAMTDTICIFIDALTYQYLWAGIHDDGFANFYHFIKSTNLFSALSSREFCSCLVMLERRHYVRGARIKCKKSETPMLFILCKGSFDVVAVRKKSLEYESDEEVREEEQKQIASVGGVVRYGASYTRRRKPVHKMKKLLCTVGAGHIFYNKDVNQWDHELTANTESMFFCIPEFSLERVPASLHSIAAKIHQQITFIDLQKKKIEQASKTIEGITKEGRFAPRTPMKRDSSIENLEQKSLLVTQGTVPIVEIREPSMVKMDDPLLNGSTIRGGFSTINNSIDINTSTSQSVILDRSFAFRKEISVALPQKLSVAKMVTSLKGTKLPPPSPLRSNLSRAARTSDAVNSRMLKHVGYEDDKYYAKSPPRSVGMTESHPMPGVPTRPLGQKQHFFKTPFESPRRVTTSTFLTELSSPSPVDSTCSTSIPLLSQFSILPEVMNAVKQFNRQTKGAQQGARLLHALRLRNGVRHRVSKLTEPRLLSGSQRRQYVRTFFGEKTSRRSSPVRNQSRQDAMKKRIKNSFDTGNFNNGFSGRFG